jgi:hypothetical protein
MKTIKAIGLVPVLLVSAAICGIGLLLFTLGVELSDAGNAAKRWCWRELDKE